MPHPGKPTVDQVIPIIRAYYSLPGNAVGGSLHTILDDGNIEDKNILFCINWAIDHGDKEGEILGSILLTMSKTQRKKLRHLI